jgi:hypothetical protein
MSSVVFHIESQELDSQFLKKLKALFKGQKLTITVTPEPKEITNPELLATLAHNEQSAISYALPADDFDKLADAFLKNNDFDIVTAIKTHRKS